MALENQHRFAFNQAMTLLLMAEAPFNFSTTLLWRFRTFGFEEEEEGHL